MAQPLLIVGGTVACLGLLLTIIATSTTYWLSRELVDNGVKISYHTGLFKYCVQANSKDICYKIDFSSDDTDKGYYYATRAMQVISILVGLGTGFLYFVCTFGIKKDPYIPVIILACLSGIFGIIGVNIFSNNLHPYIFDLGWSFYMGWVGAVLILVGNSCYIWNRRMLRAGLQRI